MFLYSTVGDLAKASRSLYSATIPLQPAKGKAMVIRARLLVSMLGMLRISGSSLLLGVLHSLASQHLGGKRGARHLA
jgi:hypothetical protein